MHWSSSSLSSDQLDALKLRSHRPSGLRAISGDSSGLVRSLLAIATNPSRFCHAQARGDIAAAVAGTVEAVPGAAGPPPWPGSCVKVSTTAAALTQDERTTSSKAVAAVAAAAVAAAAVAAAAVAAAAVAAAADAVAVAAAAVAALTLSGRKTVLLCSHGSRFIFLLSHCQGASFTSSESH